MGNNLDALTTVFTEFYYWVTVVFMFLIHVGFCLYEVAASRRRNHLHTLMKNTMVIPLGHGDILLLRLVDLLGIPQWARSSPAASTGNAGSANTPWSQTMGTNLGDRITGVFWAAFLLFSWTAASIVSGSVIERIRSGAFWMHAVFIGSVFWIIDAAWGWHYAGGWMVKILGLSRCLCLRCDPCHRWRLCSWCSGRSWSAPRQIPRRRYTARYPATQHLAGYPWPVHDLHKASGASMPRVTCRRFRRKASAARSPVKPGRQPTSTWPRPRCRPSPSTS